MSFVSALKRQPGGRIWCVGGGVLASALVSAGLIDEIDLFIQPIVLGEGVPLWVPPMTTRSFSLVEARSWPGDLVQVRYRLSDTGVTDEQRARTKAVTVGGVWHNRAGRMHQYARPPGLRA